MTMANYIDTSGSVLRLLGAVLSLRGLARRLVLWGERARQRRALASLSDHALRDIGLSRADALDEAEKPFWRS